MEKYDLIIMDFNNLFFRSFIIPWKDDEEYTAAQRQMNLKLFLDAFNKIDDFFKEGLGYEPKIVMVSDFPIDPSFEKLSSKYYRRLIYPEYKANRKQKRPEIAEDMENAIELLKTHRDDLHLISVPGYEADDLVGEVLDLFKGKKVCLVSNDGDWCINLKQGQVDILQASLKELGTIDAEDKILTEEKFTAEKGYKPNPGVLLYKCIRGDQGDNIPKGVLRMPEELVNHIAKTYESVDNLIEKSKDDEVIPQKWKDKIQENVDQLHLNEKLVGRIRLKEGTNILDYNYDCAKEGV